MARKEFDIDEDSHGELVFSLEDENGNAVESASIGSIVCTFIEQNSGSTINSRSNQDVLNTNNCTMHATSGLFTWNIQVADTDIVNASTPINAREPHLATFTVTWDTTKKMHFEVLLNVLNLRSVPHA